MQQRRFQQEFVDAVILKAEAAQRRGETPFVVVGDIFPGSGKTLTMLQTADILHKQGLIDALVILVPRLNLAMQIEASWKINRPDFEPNALGYINHRINKWPLIRKGEAGYTTTYQSLIANPELHLDQLKGKRVLLALDEAQQLGADYVGTDVLANTASAEQVQRLVESLQIVGVLVLSGTPFRADGSRLLFANYETREDGKDYLVADVNATYADGIEGGYLRQFEANLYDGEVDWQTADADLQTLTLSEYDRGLSTFLRDSPGYWNGLVNRFVEHLSHSQTMDRRFCGLVACYNQSQATDVTAYLARCHPYLRILKAISDDGEEAQRNLARFRDQHFDVLVTVQMAYMGYDQPWISVVLPLTGIREHGYLRQLFARSLRVERQLPYAKQTAIWVVPADPRMKEFIEAERQQLEIGLKRREMVAAAENEESIPLSTQEQGWVVDGRITEHSAMGFYEEGDVEGHEIPLLEQLIAEMGLGITVTNAKALMQRYADARQNNPLIPPDPAAKPFKTQREQEKEALNMLQDGISNVIHQSGFFRKHCKCDPDWGKAQQAVRTYFKESFGKAVSALDLDEIQRQLETVQEWLKTGSVPDAVTRWFWRLQ